MFCLNLGDKFLCFIGEGKPIIPDVNVMLHTSTRRDSYLFFVNWAGPNDKQYHIIKMKETLRQIAAKNCQLCYVIITCKVIDASLYQIDTVVAQIRY